MSLPPWDETNTGAWSPSDCFLTASGSFLSEGVVIQDSLTVCTAKTVSECVPAALWWPWPNPSFVPLHLGQEIFRSRHFVLHPIEASRRQNPIQLLCPVCVLVCYVEYVAPFWCTADVLWRGTGEKSPIQETPSKFYIPGLQAGTPRHLNIHT